MTIETIQVTEPDMVKLAALLDRERRWPILGREHTRVLRRKLAGAEMVRSDAIPGDIITLHSRVRLKDVDTGEHTTFVLEMPAYASAAAGTISVLSPLGAALMGCRQGHEIELREHSGVRRLSIERVLYQPEAATRGPARARARDMDRSHRQETNAN